MPDDNLRGAVERKEIKEGLLLQNTIPRDGFKVVGGGCGSVLEEIVQTGGESQSEESLNSLEGLNVLNTSTRDAEVCFVCVLKIYVINIEVVIAKICL